MADTYHQDITVADGIHIIQKYEVADESARNALSAPPIGSVVRQTDNESWWITVTTTPTFIRLDTDTFDATTPTTADILVWDGAQWANPAMSGDATITSGGVVTVEGLQGVTISTTTPTNGTFLVYDGTASMKWEPAQISGDVSINYTGSVAVPTVEAIQGRSVQDVTPADGEVLTWVTSSNRWEPSSGASANATSIQSIAVDAAAPTDAQIFIYDGSVDNEWEPKSVSGDISITRDGVVTVTQIRGAAVDAASPTDAQLLIYDASVDNEYEPKSLSGDVTITRDGVATVANHLPTGGGTMSGDINMGNNDITNIKGIEVPNATATGSFPTPSAHAGNVYIHYNATGADTYALYFSNGATWERLTDDRNEDGEIISTTTYNTNTGRLVLPGWASVPSTPSGGEIVYEATEDRLQFYDNTGATWRRCQVAQKLTFESRFYINASGKTSGNFYSWETVGTNPYELTEDRGSGPSTTSFINGQGFLVPENGTIVQCYISAMPVDTGGGAGDEIAFMVQKVVYDYNTGRSSTVTNLASSAATLDVSNAYPQAGILTLTTTSVSAGDILIPMVSCNDFAGVGNIGGHFCITIEVNEV